MRRNPILITKSEDEMKQAESIPVLGIRLRKAGKYTVVDAEIGGTWIEVIRELSDGEFCHIVEPSGMFSAYYTAPIMPLDKPAAVPDIRPVD